MTGWTIRTEGAALVLSRPGRQRLDFSARAELSALPVSRRRLAHQVRQDLWRALQDLRGFSPVVRIEPGDGAVAIVAGGQVDGAVPPDLGERAASVLSDPANRRRWLTHARVKC